MIEAIVILLLVFYLGFELGVTLCQWYYCKHGIEHPRLAQERKRQSQKT
jgi:uncharacterized membrane protein YciS (DUF1049 family)